MSRNLQDRTKLTRTSTRLAGSEPAAEICNDSTWVCRRGRLLSQSKSQRPNRAAERKAPVGSCRCRVHAAAGRPKTFRSERGDPQRTRNPTDHTQRPRVPRLAAPGKHCATIIEHRRCSFPRRFFPRVEHRPSRTPRSTRRTQRSIHHSVEFGAHTPLPRTGRRWEQRRRGRGRAGQGPAVAGPCMSHLKRKRGGGRGGGGRGGYSYDCYALPKPPWARSAR